MDWRELWARNAQKADEHAQVSRITKEKISKEQLDQIAAYIAKQIDLRKEDRLLDLCCGNGIITLRLAEFCDTIVGVDFSPEQIRNAKNRQVPNVDFIQGDAMKVDEIINEPFDKIVCHFSFQYFDSFRKGFTVLQKMKSILKPGGCIFLGDIPDYDKKGIFFPLWIPRLRHEARRILGREPMGKFWKKKSLNRMARKLKLEGKVVEQSPDMFYAHYRYDYILYKPSKYD
jgi:ubiquinone/menaquinone biosynthesis C-methylase UbiE